MFYLKIYVYVTHNVYNCLMLTLGRHLPNVNIMQNDLPNLKIVYFRQKILPNVHIMQLILANVYIRHSQIA